MRAAAANHSRVTRDALTGNGMDRHLFALRKLAEAEGGMRPGSKSRPSACGRLIVRSRNRCVEGGLRSWRPSTSTIW